MECWLLGCGFQPTSTPRPLHRHDRLVLLVAVVSTCGAFARHWANGRVVSRGERCGGPGAKATRLAGSTPVFGWKRTPVADALPSVTRRQTASILSPEALVRVHLPYDARLTVCQRTPTHV